MLAAIAVEDELSAYVAERLIGGYVPRAEITQVMVLEGINNIRGRMRDLVQIARFQDMVLVLADMDNPRGCPPGLLNELCGGLTIASNIIIRIAMLEIEAWILADREGVAQWLGIAANIVPRNPESLADPKRTLVQLAGRSRNRRLREAIAPARVTGTHRTGPNYNETVGDFVTRLWSPQAARHNAPSLHRAVLRIAELATP